MGPLQAGNLQIEVLDGDPVTFNWLGESDARNPGSHIDPFMDDHVNRCNGRSFVIDFSRLAYMNSSTVGPIIRLLRLLNSNKIQTSVIYNEHLEWQRVSFKALLKLSKMFKYIEVRGV